MASSEDILKKIAAAETAADLPVKKKLAIVITAPKMSNEYLRRFVDKMFKKKIDEKTIIKSILDYDELVQSGKLDEQKILSLRKKK